MQLSKTKRMKNFWECCCVSTSHEGKYTDHFTFAWDITVSQPIIVLYSYTFVLRSEGRHIKFLNPDHVQIHTGFHHFMEIGKICHNKNIFSNNNNNNNKLSKLKLRDEIIRWFARLHSRRMDWPISCLNPSYPESYTEEIWVQSGMRLLLCHRTWYPRETHQGGD